MDGLVYLTDVVRTIIFRSEKCKVMLDQLRSLTHDWFLMKILLMGSLNGVKCCFSLKARSGF